MFTAPTPFQWLAPSIFTLDLAVQIYGIFASPSLSDVHYANLSIFSPNLSFVIVGFSPLQLLQVIWLWKIWRSGFNPPFIQHDPVDKDGQLMLAYVPYFVLCHICLAAWTILWIFPSPPASLIPIIINALAQNYFYFFVLPQRMQSSPLTAYVSTTMSAISIIDVLHIGSVTFFNHKSGPSHSSIWLIFMTTMFFLGLETDAVYGTCLMFGVTAFAAAEHQNPEWRKELCYTAAAVSLAAVGKRVFHSRLSI